LVGRNFIVKNAKIFLKTMQKIPPKNSLPRLESPYCYREILKKIHMLPTYDVNDHLKTRF